MHTGHVISGLGHLGLLGWVVLGGLFAPEPEPVELTEVSVISSADFEAMLAAGQPPQSVTEVAQPPQPEVSVETPELNSTADAQIEQPAPLPTEAPSNDAVPDVTELVAPPEAEVLDTPPELSEPVGDVAVLVPETAPEAAPQDIDRVAPQPVAQPNPDAAIDPVEQEAAAPDATGEATEQEAQEATAPEAATTEIVTEATAAPAASTRPPGRKPAAPGQQAAAPAPEAEPAEEAAEAPSDPVSNDDVLAALQAAQEPAPVPTGPPLTSGERDALRVAVSQCWNIGSLSTEALSTIVVIGVEMNQNGTPVTSSIRMISATGGSNAAAQRVFDSARRAIIRCGARGFNLPAEKYGQWQTIEMTFDPSKMGF